MVSPTGLDGFCNANIGWKLPFHGIIKAAWGGGDLQFTKSR